LVEVGDVVSFDDFRKRQRVECLESKVRACVSELGGLDVSSMEEFYRLAPANPLAFVGLALRDFHRHDYESAVRHVNDALHVDPANREATLLKLYFIQELVHCGCFSFAEADFFVNRTFNSYPEDADMMERLLNLAVNTFNDYGMARAFYEQGMRIDAARFSAFQKYVEDVREQPKLSVVR
jgi:tetratricopeptide (TPR) repeat protein